MRKSLRKFTLFILTSEKSQTYQQTLVHYAIPSTSEEIISLRGRRADEEALAVAILGVIRMARTQGRSLEELTAEVLSEDGLLDWVQRHWLSKMVTQAWQSLPPGNLEQSTRKEPLKSGN